MARLGQNHRHQRCLLAGAQGVMAVIGIIWLAGCNDPVAREHIAAREQNMRRTARMIEEIDEAEPRALGWAVNALSEQNDLDMKRTAENPGKVNALIDEDFRRFQENQPLYRQEIETQLKGDPDKIKNTLPDMLY